MQKNSKGILSGVGFYTTLGVCLLLAAVGGYFLLTEQPEQTAEPASEVTAPTSMPEIVPIPQPSEPEAWEPEQSEAEPVTAPEPEPAAKPAASPAKPVTAPQIVVDDAPVVAREPRLIVSPLDGDVAAAFAMDALIYNETLGDWRTHDGVDIAADAGTVVLAACSGTVLQVEDDALMGTTVVLDHGEGYQTLYAGLERKPPLEVGDGVSAGQIIGTVGVTAAAESALGPHLHFSVSRDGDAVDPAAFLDGRLE